MNIPEVFPRKHKEKPNLEDTGEIFHRIKCPSCTKYLFSWVSLDYCMHCKHTVDHWNDESLFIQAQLTGYSNKEFLRRIHKKNPEESN